MDTITKEIVQNSVIAILASDSTLLQFTRSKKDGSFLLINVPEGNNTFCIYHPHYSTYTLPLLVTNHKNIDLGMLKLDRKVVMLSSIIVKPHHIPPRINGDTLEFNVNYLKLKANASVEELLKRLPGVEIDQNGNIVVNGEKIGHLLVDGEDIFGNNPSIFTRNFNADMISKVEVLNKKSKQSEFSGIDDGQNTKTINLILKEDKKRGAFTKLEAGDSPQGYYNYNGLLGSFKGTEQFVLLALAANNGNISLNG
ncbi:MAG TPA: hypothetical protein VE035_19440, partial [Puia sp.]|nr:hypothetical protein [Puia sp.]